MEKIPIATVWKLQNYFVAKNLREIKVGESRVSKSAILTNWKALSFDFYEFVHYMTAKFNKLSKFRASKMTKTADLELLDSLLAEKSWVIEKSWISRLW